MSGQEIGYLGVISLLMTVSCWHGMVHATCRLRAVEDILTIDGYEHHPITYNICRDNTIISSRRPSIMRSLNPSFVRECCGCRVSSTFDRQFTMETLSRPRESHLFYFTDIRDCECIDCFRNHNLTRLMLYLKHRRR